MNQQDRVGMACVPRVTGGEDELRAIQQLSDV